VKPHDHISDDYISDDISDDYISEDISDDYISDDIPSVKPRAGHHDPSLGVYDPVHSPGGKLAS
jgi:hypothetical protein